MPRKAKYNWGAIKEDYKNGVKTKDICEKYKMPQNTFRTARGSFKIEKIYEKKLFRREADKIRNIYYFEPHITQKEISEYFNVVQSNISQIVNYKQYTKHLNLTPQQIKALHQEMKRKRKELQEEAKNV